MIGEIVELPNEVDGWGIVGHAVNSLIRYCRSLTPQSSPSVIPTRLADGTSWRAKGGGIGGATAIAELFDITASADAGSSLGKLKMSFRDDPAACFIAGVAIAISEGTTNLVVGDGTADDFWVYLEIDRANATAKIKTKKATGGNLTGTDSVENYPLYTVPITVTAGVATQGTVVDLRRSVHITAMA